MSFYYTTLADKAKKPLEHGHADNVRKFVTHFNASPWVFTQIHKDFFKSVAARHQGPSIWSDILEALQEHEAIEVSHE